MQSSPNALVPGGPPRRGSAGEPGGGWRLGVLGQTEHVAVGVGDSGHQAAAAHVAGGILDRGTRGGDLGQLGLDFRHVPVGHRRGQVLGAATGQKPDVLAGDVEADVVGPVGLGRLAEQRGCRRPWPSPGRRREQVLS